MKKSIILALLTLTSLFAAAQSSIVAAKPKTVKKATVKKSMVPKSYAVVATPKTILAPAPRRILKIDLDSLLLNNNLTLSDNFKGDSTNTRVEYTINVYSMPNPSDSIQVGNMQGNIYLKITEIRTAKYAQFKQREIDRLNEQIDKEEKQKQEIIKRREEIRKQN